jgi:N-acetylglucosamine-6-phosphate deacetylase
LNEKNIITQAGHSVSESIKECRGVTHLFNAMPQIHHRDNSFTLQALLNDYVYCEIIADLIHVSLNALKLAFKMKSCDKILLISDSLPIAHFDNEIVFCGKKINILAQDENGTLAGSNKTLDEICNNLLNEGILTEQEILKMAFDNQIKYLNLSNAEIDILNA